MGSGLGQSFFLAVTLISGQEVPHRAVILSKFTIMSSFEECSILEVDVGHTFLRVDSLSPGYTFFSVGGMAQGGEWFEQLFLRENSFSPGYTLFSVEGMAQGGE
jgi:hypothetical protein